MPPQHDRSMVLSVHQAFVVQFASDTQIDASRIAGRVEHVVSGQVARFESLEVLLTFVDRVLHERRRDTPEASPEGTAGLSRCAVVRGERREQ
jgi:hypothetical protein